MTAPPGHDSPYPAAPPSSNEPPQWFKWAWQAFSRIAAFGIGAVLAFLPDGTDTQVTGGIGLMALAAGLAVVKGWK